MKARILILLLCVSTFLVGCVVHGEPVRYKTGADTLVLNAKADGRTLTAFVYINEQLIITHHWPPFINSREEKTAQYKDYDVRSVMRIIKGLGNTTVQIYVYIDDNQAAEFFF